MLDFKTVEKILEAEAPYRRSQVRKAVFSDLINDWFEATTLPQLLRDQLTKVSPLAIVADSQVGSDEGTTKATLSLDDGLTVEAVLMRHGDGRRTVCVSSQIGCSLGCVFCLTGQMGFRRDLTASEIVAQVLFFARELKKVGEKVSNVVLMGMGEPFLNYDNVLAAVRILNDPEGFNLGARRISISTVGIVPGIERLAGENLEINLAVSLHAPNDELRSPLVPINKTYPIATVLAAVDRYIERTRRRVMFEYVMIEGVNDSDACARELAQLLRGKLGFVNLIRYNPTQRFRSSPSERIKAFRAILEQAGLEVTERYRFGRDIKAACGQLASADGAG